jgi:hypothetical protein
MLSVIGELNRAGYLVVFFLGGMVALACLRVRPVRKTCWHLPARRFRRWLPLGFIVLAALSLVGGMAYPPSNFDALAYRLPRILHWLQAQQWQWIHTPDGRMNTRACGFEWMATPLIALTGSDRSLFVINWISFLLLPGVLFSFLKAYRVPARVAWSWAWIFPTGYCYLTQAGSIANDAWAAVYVLASLTLARRFKVTRSFGDGAFSLLGIALATGAKAMNLALLLPWAVAILPAWPLLALQWRKWMMVLPAAVLVSFLPTAMLNVAHCGDWTGMVIERNRYTLQSPLIGLAGNTILLLWFNLIPPFCPWASSFVRWYPHSHLYQSLDWFNRSFEGGYWTYINVMPSEGWSGVGLGIVILLLASVIAAGFEKGPAVRRDTWGERALFSSPYFAFLAVMGKSALAQFARLVSPYYPPLLPWLLARPAQSQIVRKTWWKCLCFCVWIVALGVVVLPPVRHLWPAQTVFRHLQALHPTSATWQRTSLIFADRPDWLTVLRSKLPSDIRRFGLIDNANEAETPLWRPYGSWSIYHLTSDDTPAVLRRENITWVVIMEEGLPLTQGRTLAQWLIDYHGTVRARQTIDIPQANDTSHWVVVQIDPPPPASP